MPDRANFATTIRVGGADCGIATRAAIKVAGLDFMPLLWENFDLVSRNAVYFEPEMQALFTFMLQPLLQQRPNAVTGYDTAPAGKFRYFA